MMARIGADVFGLIGNSTNVTPKTMGMQLSLPRLRREIIHYR